MTAQPTHDDPLLDPGMVGARLGKSRVTGRALLLSGALPIIRVKDRMFVRESDLDAYLEQRDRTP